MSYRSKNMPDKHTDLQYLDEHREAEMLPEGLTLLADDEELWDDSLSLTALPPGVSYPSVIHLNDGERRKFAEVCADILLKEMASRKKNETWKRFEQRFTAPIQQRDRLIEALSLHLNGAGWKGICKAVGLSDSAHNEQMGWRRILNLMRGTRGRRGELDQSILLTALKTRQYPEAWEAIEHLLLRSLIAEETAPDRVYPSHRSHAL